MGRPKTIPKSLNRLTFVERLDRQCGKNYYAVYRCDCGNRVEALISNVNCEDTKSCGCFREENNLVINKKHGLHNTVEYKAFDGAKQRCFNPNHKNYNRYGGRGIEFRFESIEQFVDHIGLRPEGMSLDRINNEGHYEIGNVRWATAKVQANNRSNNVARSK